MEKAKLNSYKEQLQYNLGQLELDYYQHYILSKLYEKFNTIYFKGGTCLQKCYGIKRFSEDLDFNYTSIEISEIIKFIEQVMKTKITNLYKTRFGISFTIKFKGILYSGDSRTLCNISFDFRKNDTYQQPLKKIIRPTYSDLNTYFLLSLSEEEILSEKIRAIMTRFKGRDVFDLNELLLNNVKINFELINKKLKTYDLIFNKNLFKKKINEKEAIYSEEISKLVKIYPSFKECKKRILKAITNINR